MAKSKRLNYHEFMRSFGWKAFEQGPPQGPGSMPPPGLDRSMQTWVPELRVLAEAAKRNCPSAFSQFLQDWLRSVGIVPPEGVFKSISYGNGRGGRNEDTKAMGIYLLWVVRGRPSLTSNKLAQEYYKTAFAAAESDERKLMKDRLRRAVERVTKKYGDPSTHENVAQV